MARLASNAQVSRQLLKPGNETWTMWGDCRDLKVDSDQVIWFDIAILGLDIGIVLKLDCVSGVLKCILYSLS